MSDYSKHDTAIAQQHHTQLYEAMQRRLAEQDALLAASMAVSSSLDLDVVLTKLVEQMARAINATSAYISDWNPSQGTSKVIAEYYSLEASEKERVSDLGTTYDLLDEFDDDQEWLKLGLIAIDHVTDPELVYFTREHLLKYGACSVLTVPLKVRDKVLGYAELWESRQHRDFTPAEIALTQAIAQQAAVAIENATLFAEKNEQLRLSRTLQDVGALLTTRLTLQEVFEQIFDLLAQIVTYDSASVQLVDGRGQLSVAASRGLAYPELYYAFASLHGKALIERFSTGSAVRIIADCHAEEGWIPMPGLEYIRSWIGAALMVKGQLIGILNMDHTQPNAYSDPVAGTVLAFANQAAVAIENARLYEETRQRANEMRVLHQVALATSVLPNVDSLLRQTTSMIAENLYPEHFGFLLINQATGELFPHPSFYGAPKEELLKPVPLDRSVCGMVIQTGKPRIISDVSSEEKYFCVLPSTQSEIVVPLTVKGKVIGVINVESSKRGAFSTNDLRFLTTLAGQVATFIERLNLYEAQRKYMAHLALEVNQRTEALKSERDRMQAILDNAGEGIFFTDEDGLILYVNSSMTRVTGYEAAELLHRTPEEWPGMRNSSHLESLVMAIEMGEGWHCELVGQHKDNSSFDIHLTIAPIYSNEGNLSGFVGVQSDISHLKEVERLKAQFISNVSHELRTPLTIIETYTTLLKQGKPERRDYYLSILSRETKRLTRLIQDVLDLSRLEAGRSLIVTEPVHLDRLLRQVSNTFLPHAETKQIALTVDMHPSLPTIWANKGQIEQVATNLVNNALVYTPEGGKVMVTSGISRENEREGAWFSITDTGSGIAPEDLSQIFDRFFRSHSAQVSSVRGTGLGLAICKEIVERHSGFIEAKSEPGQGSVFTVWLPVGEPPKGA